jgi:putative intracellular protease/amidase
MTTKNDTKKNVLMIVTSHAQLGESGQKTGFWLEELAAPYNELASAGFAVDIASPLGGKPPADPKSESSEAASVKRFTDDRDAVAKLEATKRLDELSSSYDAYFVVGGHGVMWDLAESDVLAKLLGRAHDEGRVVAAVCHGPAALSRVKDASGAPLVKGKRVAGFSNEEEDAVGLTGVVPFALETRLRDLGARYERGPKWGSFAVRDDRLVTGQNPASSAAVAKLVIEALA